jgi:hypothetical protein
MPTGPYPLGEDEVFGEGDDLFAGNRGIVYPVPGESRIDLPPADEDGPYPTGGKVGSDIYPTGKVGSDEEFGPDPEDYADEIREAQIRRRLDQIERGGGRGPYPAGDEEDGEERDRITETAIDTAGKVVGKVLDLVGKEREADRKAELEREKLKLQRELAELREKREKREREARGDRREPEPRPKRPADPDPERRSAPRRDGEDVRDKVRAAIEKQKRR